MARRRNKASRLGEIGQTTVRVAVAAYFVTGALGLFPGVGIVPVVAEALPGLLPQIIAQTVVVALGLLILTGHALRPAALLLSIGLFWSSYLKMQMLGVSAELGHFWRDMGLIGILLLTYVEPQQNSDLTRLFRRKRPLPRLGDRVVPRRVTPTEPNQALIRFPQKAPEYEAVPVAGPEPVFSSARMGKGIVPLKVSATPATEFEDDEDNIFAVAKGREAG